MIYLESKIVDPYWNLALEQYLFETVGQTADCFMLWQNKGSIIIGRHQNTIRESHIKHNKESKKHNKRLTQHNAQTHTDS